MSLSNWIRISMRAASLWRRGKNVYQHSEQVKEKVEQIQSMASGMYKKAGSPDAAQVGAAIGKGAANAFLKLKKLKKKLEE